jgi:hypothetical protein
MEQSPVARSQRPQNPVAYSELQNRDCYSPGTNRASRRAHTGVTGHPVSLLGTFAVLGIPYLWLDAQQDDTLVIIDVVKDNDTCLTSGTSRKRMRRQYSE